MTLRPAACAGKTGVAGLFYADFTAFGPGWV